MRRKSDPHAWMDNLSASGFDTTVREVFAFLCREYGFAVPIMRDSTLLMIRSYRAHRVSVEISFDRRDRAVEVALVRLTEGKRPEGWKFDASGNQFMIRLYEAAWHRKLPNARVIVPQGTSAEGSLRLWLEAWANQLQTQFTDVLKDSDALFEELNRLRRQHQGPTKA